MNFLGLILTAISLFPIWILHRFSDVTYFGIYYLMGYRRKVVWQNLKNSFPEKSDAEILRLQKKIYRYFCDLIFETIKTFTISEEEIRRRCVLTNEEFAKKLFQEQKSMAMISSHMGNWEWGSLAVSLQVKPTHQLFAVYKPLASKKLNDVVIRSRERFGANFVAIKNLKSVLENASGPPYIVGLISDQAPHDYSKAFEIPFLNQSTFFVPGPGVLSVQRKLIPVFAWIRRVGRSRYEWRLEVMDESTPALSELSSSEQEQVMKISKAHGLEVNDAVRAFIITRAYANKLEAEMKMAPQDWLWSHRRWKTR